MKPSFKTQVLIIGGGATGTGMARDLALRGICSLLVEKRDINSGASGANHGLLHSGGRYVFNDPETAEECRIESEILKRTATHCIEDTGGLFVAVEGDDETYIRDFPEACARCGIATQEISPSDACEMEPALSSKVIAAYAVQDASIDPFRLSLDNIDQAIEMGSRVMCHSQVVDFKIAGNRIQQVILKNTLTDEIVSVEADQVINASGTWAGEVAALAGVAIDMAYSKGSLLVSNHRITDRVINRLRPPADGDILVPGGTVSLLGTTSIRLKTLEDIRPTVPEIDTIIEKGAAMLPILDKARFIRAYSGVRPLVSSQQTQSDRSISRGFALLDHAQQHIENFVTITGGKLTTYRYMAEKTVDLVCNKLGVTAACTTHTVPLPPSPNTRWTTPGLAPKEWIQQDHPEDIILCECEMVPKSVINSILSDVRKLGIQGNLKAIGLRSRIGKGSCQGAFCSARITAHMYDENELFADGGLQNMRTFLDERWKGLRPVLWDLSLVQEELQEAMHCGFFGLEL